MSTDNKDIWYRAEFKNRLGELSSRAEYEQANGLKKDVLISRFRFYADRVPALVVDRWRSGVYRERVYVTSELDAFMKSITGHDSPRSPLEVARAEVARREGSVAEYTRRRDNKQAEVEKAQRLLDNQVRKLKQAKEALRIEEELSSSDS